MGGLHRLIGLKILLLLLIWQIVAYSADYCSMSVRVLSPDNRRPLEVPVSVREQSGRVVEKETTSEDLKFCDLGITPVTVTIGGGRCNQVVVRDIPLVWEEEYALTITYDPEPCMPERPRAPVPVCEVLFRVADRNGTWLGNALIEFQSSGSRRLETDKAGRALRLLKAGDQVSGNVTFVGYNSKAFTISCSISKRVQELMISLERF